MKGRQQRGIHAKGINRLEDLCQHGLYKIVSALVYTLFVNE
jgi:hypothetical protein